MTQAAVIQMNLPRLEADGTTHTRDCECPRCDAGFRPSERQRREAAALWRQHQDRAKAHEALERMEARQRRRALKLTLSLEGQVRATDVLLKKQTEQERQANRDEQLDELLRLRARGVPIAEALAAVDRLPARRALRR